MFNSPRERLLEAASLLFHTQGYNNTGINQIVIESKVSKASFYDHFKSKDELCMAFLERRFKYWTSQWEFYISTALTQKDKILKSFDFLMYMNDKEDFRGCSFLNISSEILDNKIQIHNTIRQHKNLLRNFFTKEIPDEILADHIYLLFEGSIMMGRLYRNNELIIKSKTIIDSLLKD